MSRFLIGNVLRTVNNGRLNCNNRDSEDFKSSNDNGTYVKKIRKNNQIFPYASSQWQKYNIKEFARYKGNNISMVKAKNSKEAYSEGNPYKNYDEDIMGFMIARNLEITKETYNGLDEVDRKSFKVAKKGFYKKNITKKRRANLMLSPLQAIGPTRITSEFSTRATDKNPILYSKEVYSTEMASGFILDIENIGIFRVSDNQAGYRDYDITEVKKLGIELDKEFIFKLDRKTKLKRIIDTIDGLRYMTTRITMTNNLEDLSARFIILGEYSIGNALFNNIFNNGNISIEDLKSRISSMEEYRLSPIYIGCDRDLTLKVIREGDTLFNTIKNEFNKNENIILGSVEDAINSYKEYLSETL